MKKLLLFVFIVLGTLGKAQITITSTNVPSSGDTARLSIAATSQLSSSYVTQYKNTGANYTWTFDSLKPTGQVMRKFEPALTYNYFSSGFVEKTADSLNLFIATFSNVCDIFKKNSNGFYMDAWGITYMGFPIPNSYSKKDSLYKFPLNYLDRDSTNFAMSTPSSSLIPFGFKKHGHRITEVDGWGTIKTPYGTEPCIRVVTTQYSIDSIKAMIPLGTFTLPINIGYPNYVRKYQWLSLTEKVPYLEISGTVLANNFMPNEVRYRDNIRYFSGINEVMSETIALAIYPNPASSEISFFIPERGKHQIQVFDVQGGLMLDEKFDNSNAINRNTLDISQLEAGIYVGRLNNGKAVQNFKFIKQ